MEHIKILQRVAEMERERYSSSGDFSVTDLINPPRVVQLRKRYGDRIEVPLASVIPAMMGTAVHEYFEKYLRMWVAKHGYEGYTFEKQVAFNFKLDDKVRKVSGRFDILDGTDMYDLKTAKVWKLIYDPQMIEWHEQQNLYDYLCHLNNIELTSLNIVAVYKDWQEGNALRDRSYPQDQICEYSLKRWSREEQKAYLIERLALHVKEEDTSDDQLPLCTREERWERHPDGAQIHYGIFKTETAKRAAKVIKGGDLADAMSIARGLPKINSNSFIEVRYARRTRCEKYCGVNVKCNDYLNYIKQVQNDQLNDYIKVMP